MHTLIYDNSFEGWLTAIFEVYEYKFTDVFIERASLYKSSLPEKEHTIITSEAKAVRVWEGLKQKLSPRALQQLYNCFLSEEKGIENTMLAYTRYAFSYKETVEHDLNNAAVLKIGVTARKVLRERRRMNAFVRFQSTADGLYYALVEPGFNVLPLITKHFKERYANQRWLIYDTFRKYGIYYNLQTVETVSISFDEQNTPDTCGMYNEKEVLYQQLWQQYLKSANTMAGKSIKLYIQCMPLQHWKYLTEKKDFM